MLRPYSQVMSTTIRTHRGRALLSLTATLGLLLAATTLPAPAQSAEPAGDCTAAFPVSGLTEGNPVTGLTVTSGTTPEPFTGEVIGVLENGIGAGLDMVMVSLTSPVIDQVGGIWQGMSGSPVYAADGRLIGAVAYGLSMGPSPIAGVTPWEEMDGYLTPARPRPVRVGAAAARTIAQHSTVTRAQAAQGFRQLQTRTGVSGLTAHRLAQLNRTRHHAWLPRHTYPLGGSGAARSARAEAGPETIVAGGNIAASLSYGDVTQAGIGTATEVCNGEVVGFGHPMAFFGNTTLTLHPADALYIQADPVSAPFKVANLGAPAGTITGDHLTGITGVFGPLPATTEVASTVTLGTRSRTGSTRVSIPDATAGTVFYQLVANHDRVVDGTTAGSELLSWTINGHASGVPFSLDATDRYVSDGDITYESGFDLADFVYSLTGIDGVTLDDVIMGSEIVTDHSTWRVTGVEQWRHGGWQPLGKGAPAVAHAGGTLVLRAVLTGATGKRTVPVRVAVPRNAAGSTARLQLVGGSMVSTPGANPTSMAQAARYAATLVRNDQVQLGVTWASSRRGSESTSTSDPVDKVVTGRRGVSVVVR